MVAKDASATVQGGISSYIATLQSEVHQSVQILNGDIPFNRRLLLRKSRFC